jgi:site-specific DNA recombinase
MGRAIIYRRVSTDEQSKTGLGLEHQKRVCEELARTLGAKDITIYTDAGISGSTEIDCRPGLRDALAALRKGDVLLVAKRDRIARDMLVSLTVGKIVERRGAKLMSAAGEGNDSDPVTDLILKTTADLWSQIERLSIGSRTKQALRVKISNGERVGNVRYGFKLARDGKHLVPNERERDIIKAVAKMRKIGLSLQRIADRLNDTKIKTRTGAPWKPSQIQRLLVAKDY